MNKIINKIKLKIFKKVLGGKFIFFYYEFFELGWYSKDCAIDFIVYDKKTNNIKILLLDSIPLKGNKKYIPKYLNLSLEEFVFKNDLITLFLLYKNKENNIKNLTKKINNCENHASLLYFHNNIIRDFINNIKSEIQIFNKPIIN